MTASEYFTQWLSGEEILVGRSTFEAYTIYITRHIAPYFGDKPLNQITPADIFSYLRDKLKNGRCDGSGGLSVVSVRKHLSIIRQSLGDAVNMGFLQTNPAQYSKLPRRRGIQAERTVFMTAYDAQEMLTAFRGHRLQPLVFLALYYGLRRSEVLGLRWSAVDFDRGTLLIRHTVVKNLTIEAKDTTKTDTSRRTFELLPEVRSMLEKLHAEQGYPVDGYLFIWNDGRLFRPDYVTRAFQKVLKAHNLPRMRFHDLRHSTASILFDMGWSLEDVKNWLGHSDIETTSNIYVHYGSARKILLSGTLKGTFHI